MKHESIGDTNCVAYTWGNPQKLVKGLEDLEISVEEETIKNTAFLRSARIRRGVLET